MGTETNIEWCDHTFNPWIGCMKVSPGCNSCYAMVGDHRYGHNNWGPAATTSRRITSSDYGRQPLRWHKQAIKEGVSRRVFSGSMCDFFEDHPDLDEPRARLWPMIDQTRSLDWLLLTKRPENIRAMVPPTWLVTPPANVWYGTSVENQKYADIRIMELLEVPAVVRFLSCEPLIGPINLLPYLYSGIHWVICGGESGKGARPMDLEWAYRLRDQCLHAGVAFFMKQMGSVWATQNGSQTHKGGDMSEWPTGLRVRQWPTTAGSFIHGGERNAK